MSVGIERLHVYAPGHVLPLASLADARRTAVAQLAQALGVVEVAVPAPCEDASTMAATAGARLLAAARIDPDHLGLLLVACRPSPGSGEAAAVVHALLKLGHHCRLVDLGGRESAGADALLLAADWVRAARARVRRALVIAVGVTRGVPGAADEAAQGAAAGAMLVGPEPAAFQIADPTGTWTARSPASAGPLRHEALGGKESVGVYLDAVTSAFGDYRPRERPEPIGEEVVTDRLARLCYHAPYPALAQAAHRAVLEADWRANVRRWAKVEPRLAEAVEVATREQVAPGLVAAAHVGDAGTAALWLSLASALERGGRMLGGRRVGLCAYGGGAAEMFTGLVPAQVGSVADTGLGTVLGQRTRLDVARYEEFVRAAETGGEPPEGFGGDFALQAAGSRREYVKVR